MRTTNEAAGLAGPATSNPTDSRANSTLLPVEGQTPSWAKFLEAKAPEATGPPGPCIICGAGRGKIINIAGCPVCGGCASWATPGLVRQVAGIGLGGKPRRDDR